MFYSRVCLISHHILTHPWQLNRVYRIPDRVQCLPSSSRQGSGQASVSDDFMRVIDRATGRNPSSAFFCASSSAAFSSAFFSASFPSVYASSSSASSFSSTSFCTFPSVSSSYSSCLSASLSPSISYCMHPVAALPFPVYWCTNARTYVCTNTRTHIRASHVMSYECIRLMKYVRALTKDPGFLPVLNDTTFSVISVIE